MDQVFRKWGPGLKANEGNVSATEPSRTLNSGGRRAVQLPFGSRCLLRGFLTGSWLPLVPTDPTIVRWFTAAESRCQDCRTWTKTIENDGSERSDLPAAAGDIDPEGLAVQRKIRRESEDKRIRAFQDEGGKSEGTRRTDRGHAKSITSGGKACLSEQQPKDDQGLPQERGRVD